MQTLRLRKSDSSENSASTEPEVIPYYASLAEGVRDLHQFAHALINGLTTSDLATIKMTAGGVLYDIFGERTSPDFRGVILGCVRTRAFYQGAYSGSRERPTCLSRDGVRGIGSPGGVCAECPNSQWDIDSHSQRPVGSEHQVVSVLQPGTLLPTHFRLPATSFKAFRQYQVGLLNQRLNWLEVETFFGLTRTTSRSGITYGQASFTFNGLLDEPTAQIAQAYAAILSGTLPPTRVVAALPLTTAVLEYTGDETSQTDPQR